MWNFSSTKTSTNNHNWKPGSLGAGYIFARSNTPDTFNLLDCNIRTWKIGPDETQDIEREYERTRPTEPILFRFYISPTGGVHDGGKGFQNRTGKPINAVLEFLHRSDNRLYNGYDEVKVNRLGSVKANRLHFNPETGEPCYCGLGRYSGRLSKEANLKYKDIMRGQMPKGLDPEFADNFQKTIQDLVEGTPATIPLPGFKKVIPWLVNQIKSGTIKYLPPHLSTMPFHIQDGENSEALNALDWQNITNLFNAEDSPYQLAQIDPEPFGNQRVDLNSLDPSQILFRAGKHKEWIKERVEKDRRKEDVAKQEKVYEFNDPEHEGWFVTKLNPSAEEARNVGLEQGNCFQNPSMGYQDRVANGELTVYVLRDPSGLGHGLWAYRPDGEIEVMENAGRIYGQDEDWEGYEMNNPELRAMVSEVNGALGFSDYYEGHNPYEEEEEQLLDEVQLPEVENVDDFVYQYHEDGDGRYELAEQIANNMGMGLDYDNLSIYEGEVDWSAVVEDLFENYEPNSVDSNDFFTTIMQGSWYMENFAKAADNYIEAWEHEAQQPVVDTESRQPKLENTDDPSYPTRMVEPEAVEEPPMFAYYRQWKGVHTNPNTGELEEPDWLGSRTQEQYEERHEKELQNPWSFMPQWNDLKTINGEPAMSENGYMRPAYLPASQNPKNRIPARETQPCQSCEGTGRSPEGWVCATCDGTGIQQQLKDITVGPNEQKVLQDFTGQMYFGKKSAVEDLKLHLARIKPKKSHSLSWVKGRKGRGLLLYDGTLTTWPVDKRGEPQHAGMYEYLTGTKLPESQSVQDFELGIPFDIYEDGTLAFFDDVSAEAIADLNKIDYRFKTSSNYEGFNYHFHPNTGQPCDCAYGVHKERDHFRPNQNRISHRFASQAVRKVKNQDQKHLRSDRGQQVLDFLHRLISGHGLGEQGEFGQGEQPGIEGMVPWIVKNLKTGWLKPKVDQNDQVSDLLTFNSYSYDSPEEIRAKLSKRNALPIDIEGVADFDAIQSSWGREGYQIVTGALDNPDVKVALINADDISEEELYAIIKSRPDVHFYLSSSFDENMERIKNEYAGDDQVDVGGAQYMARFVLRAVDEAEGEFPVDYSMEIPDGFYRPIPWESWSNWFNASNSPARQGKDIMKMNPSEVSKAVQEHEFYVAELERMERLKEQYAELDDSVVYRIQDPKFKGWTVNQIRNSEEAEMESEVLGHCIGSEEQPYARNIDEGNIQAFSLRDENGIPKLSWHYNHDDDSLAHVQGKSNDSYDMYRHLVTEFNNATDRDDDQGGGGEEHKLPGTEAEEVNLPPRNSMEEYIDQYNDPYEQAYDIAEQDDMTVGQNTMINPGEVLWDDILNEMFRYGEDSNKIKDFMYCLEENMEISDFVWHADQFFNRMEYNKMSPDQIANDEDGLQNMEMYRNWRALHTDPSTGEYKESEQIPHSKYDELKQRWEESEEAEGGFAYPWPEYESLKSDPLGLSEDAPTAGEFWNNRGFLPASMDPRLQYQKHDPVMEETACTHCQGTGQNANEADGLCHFCKGTGKREMPAFEGDTGIYQEPSGQLYYAKLSSEEKASAWDRPAETLNPVELAYVEGRLVSPDIWSLQASISAPLK